MPGRSTLTTTSRPSGSTAACTCAMDADASGVSSKLVKICDNGCLYVALERLPRQVPGNGGT